MESFTISKLKQDIERYHYVELPTHQLSRSDYAQLGAEGYRFHLLDTSRIIVRGPLNDHYYCQRCGHDGHRSLDCEATRHLDGSKLPASRDDRCNYYCVLQ